MKSRIVKAEIDINELKKEAVHPGLLEVMLLLRKVREKVSTLMEEDEVSCYSAAVDILNRISDGLLENGSDIGDIIGFLFTERAEINISKQNGTIAPITKNK